jgi:hypothetical protein
MFLKNVGKHLQGNTEDHNLYFHHHKHIVSHTLFLYSYYFLHPNVLIISAIFLKRNRFQNIQEHTE